jgi:branched-chain amino acid transport system permease protein
MVLDQIVSIVISTGNFYAIWLILTLSLNYEYGYNGILNFGKVLFFGVGAFAAGYVVANLANFVAGVAVDMCSAQAVQLRLETARASPVFAFGGFLLAMAAGSILAGIVGLLLTSSTNRIKEGFILGIVLLAAGETSRIVVRNYEPIACGYHGLVGIPNPFLFIGDAQTSTYYLSILIWAVAAINFFIMVKVSRSPYGRMLKAMRENELAAESFGKNINKVRRQVLFIGSMMSGLAGVLYAYYIGFVAADDFTSLKTFDIWVAMMLGGVGNHVGAASGAFLVTVIDRGTRTLRGWLATLNIPIEMLYVRWIIVGVLMLIVLMYRPNGLIPEGPIRTPAYRLFDTANLRWSRWRKY